MTEVYRVRTSSDGPLAWSHAERRLEGARSYWIATTRPGGKPHAAPVWGVYVGGSLYFGTGRSSVKGRNLHTTRSWSFIWRVRMTSLSSRARSRRFTTGPPSRPSTRLTGRSTTWAFRRPAMTGRCGTWFDPVRRTPGWRKTSWTRLLAGGSMEDKWT